MSTEWARDSEPVNACAKCGGALGHEHIDEPSQTGRFLEIYRCRSCGAKGYVEGREEDPFRKWDRYGEAFD